MSRFPNVLAAVELRAKHQGQIDGSDLWAIGDALIKDVELQIDKASGATPDAPYSKAERARFDVCAKELATKGYPEYSADRLAELRSTARFFPRGRRHSHELSFFVHTEAGDPDFLDWCIKKRGKKLSAQDVRVMRKHLEEIEDEARDRRLKDAQDKKRRASTDKERDEAEREIADNKGPPKGGFTPPDKDDENELMLVADVMRVDLAAKQLTSTLRDHQQKLRKMEDNLTEDLTESLIEKYESIVQVAQQLVDFLKTSKRNRFKLIKGGRHAS